ncbi:MAG TPA: 23S rRNA (uracil(1939)-C(5))-methyltransferase RlmD [Pseudidiomarina sp.]|nr:23S rRNA (uracil(1939)-C(5))-methyltransferase RlmD [Pseudidiomarina sp.]
MAQIYRQASRTLKQAKISKPTAVVGLDHQARGIVRSQQGTRFIEGAVPGDVIRYQSDGKYTARLIEVITPSPHRMVPPCPIYDACGGCDMQHLRLDQQRQHKQQVVTELLQKFAGTKPELWLPPLVGAEFGYRRRTRLAVHWHAKRQTLKLGFRAKQSKNIIDIADCMVLEPALNRLLQPLRKLLPQLAFVRNLGHIELYLAATPVVLLRLSSWLLESMTTADQAQLKAFAETSAVAVWLQLDAGDPIAVAGNPQRPRYATTLPSSSSGCGVELQYMPGDFIQANTDMSERMVEQAIHWLDPQPTDTILELYAGTGNFSVPIAASGAQLIAVEGVSRMVQRLQANLDEALGTQHRGIAIQADLNQPTPALPSVTGPMTKALLDPARTGAQYAVALLVERLPQRIIYVSCAPDTLARDAGYLCQHGYFIKQAQVVDMFPQTHHIETIVWFERES